MLDFRLPHPRNPFIPIMPQTLILQSPHLARAALPISHHYFDLPATLPNDILRLPTHGDYPRLPAAAAAEFQQQQIDYALIPDTPFAALKLVVSDMDSTLITIECIDEIAASAGLKDQIAEITERAMQGEVDFEQSLRHRVALLKGQPENQLAEVYEHKLQLAQGAEEFIRDCQAHGIRFLLVSGGFTYFTDRLQSRLGLDWAFANQLEIINGRLTGKVLGRVIDAQAKAGACHWRRRKRHPDAASGRLWHCLSRQTQNPSGGVHCHQPSRLGSGAAVVYMISHVKAA